MKNLTSTCALLSTVWSLGLNPTALDAQTMLSPVAISGSNLGVYNDTVPFINMINQSGVLTPFVSGVTSFDTYFAKPGQVFAESGNGGIYNWSSELASDLGVQGYVDFDLGASYSISKVAIWNRSMKSVKLQVFDNANGPIQTADTFQLINRLSFTFSYAVDILPFKAPLQGRYLRLGIESIYPLSPPFLFGLHHRR